MLKVSIRTFGCQMNRYDSEVATGLLAHQGYEIIQEFDVEHKDLRKTDMDVVLMNTCSVREHAEERVYGRLGMLGKAKRSNPNLIIGLMGCMVEEHKEKLFRRFPQLDLMVGTRNISELPELIETVRKNREQVSKIKQDGISIEYTDQIKRQGKFHAWLPIMTGCNKVCTFCIVPITRGAEVSMRARDVYREASRLVEEGVKWITLLGQNVNSYKGRWKAEDRGWKEEMNDLPSPVYLQPSTDFPDLLALLCEIDGLEKISFTTSHPHDATEDLFQVIRKNPKISRRFHLPLQSGSDRILKRMKRLHTFEEYKQKIHRLRELVPDISITTDIIAGFSGEDDQDHQATIKALQELRYAGAYIYKYSLRASTPAVNMPDDVPLSVKEQRNQDLLRVQLKIRDEINQGWIGKTINVFFEEVNPQDQNYLIGRSDHEKRVTAPDFSDLIGSFHQVKIERLRGETFFGEIVDK